MDQSNRVLNLFTAPIFGLRKVKCSGEFSYSQDSAWRVERAEHSEILAGLLAHPPIETRYLGKILVIAEFCEYLQYDGIVLAQWMDVGSMRYHVVEVIHFFSFFTVVEVQR